MENPQVEKLKLVLFGVVPCGIPQAGSWQVLQGCAFLE